MIVLTQGDALPLDLTCKDTDLSGATMTTKFKGSDGKDVEIDDDAHEPDADQTTNKGKFVLTLTAANTKKFAVGTTLSIITKIVQGGTVRHFHGERILTVKKGTFRE